jgi:hypothetical protein
MFAKHNIGGVFALSLSLDVTYANTYKKNTENPCILTHARTHAHTHTVYDVFVSSRHIYMYIRQ